MDSSTGLPEDRVSVKLVLLSGQDELPDRYFSLTPSTSMPVGRSSKSEQKNLLAADNNCYINNPVISREHAVLRLSAGQDASVTVRDEKSMHGTLVNENIIRKHVDHNLNSGDYVQFGTDVTRGEETFKAPKYIISIFKNPTPGDLFSPSTFRMPDSVPKSGFYVPDSDSSPPSSVISVDDSDDEDNAADSDSSAPVIAMTAPKQPHIASPEIPESAFAGNQVINFVDDLDVGVPTGSRIRPIAIDDVEAVPESLVIREADSDVESDVEEHGSEDDAGSEASSEDESDHLSTSERSSSPLEHDNESVCSSEHLEDHEEEIEPTSWRDESLAVEEAVSEMVNSIAADVDTNSDRGAFANRAATGSPVFHPLDPQSSQSKRTSFFKNLMHEPALEAPAPTRRLRIDDMLNNRHEDITKATPPASQLSMKPYSVFSSQTDVGASFRPLFLDEARKPQPLDPAAPTFVPSSAAFNFTSFGQSGSMVESSLKESSIDSRLGIFPQQVLGATDFEAPSVEHTGKTSLDIDELVFPASKFKGIVPKIYGTGRSSSAVAASCGAGAGSSTAASRVSMPLAPSAPLAGSSTKSKKRNLSTFLEDDIFDDHHFFGGLDLGNTDELTANPASHELPSIATAVADAAAAETAALQHEESKDEMPNTNQANEIIDTAKETVQEPPKKRARLHTAATAVAGAVVGGLGMFVALATLPEAFF